MLPGGGGVAGGGVPVVGAWERVPVGQAFLAVGAISSLAGFKSCACVFQFLPVCVVVQDSGSNISFCAFGWLARVCFCPCFFCYRF